MILRVWGVVNSTTIEFHPLEDKPGYWEGFAPRIPGLQNIEIWAENDKGARGHLDCQVAISWNQNDEAHLVLHPYVVRLITRYRVGLRTIKAGGGCMCETINFRLGEKKNIPISIRSTTRSPFEVTNARYFLKSGSSVEDKGECTIVPGNDGQTEWIVSALVTPQRKCAKYTLEFHYDIFPEKFIHEVQIRVM